MLKESKTEAYLRQMEEAGQIQVLDSPEELQKIDDIYEHVERKKREQIIKEKRAEVTLDKNILTS